MIVDTVWKSCDEYETYYLCDPALVEKEEDEEGRWISVEVYQAIEEVIKAARYAADEEGQREVRACYRAITDLDEIVS